jgi:hypothetical protein
MPGLHRRSPLKGLGENAYVRGKPRRVRRPTTTHAYVNSAPSVGFALRARAFIPGRASGEQMSIGTSLASPCGRRVPTTFGVNASVRRAAVRAPMTLGIGAIVPRATVASANRSSKRHIRALYRMPITYPRPRSRRGVRVQGTPPMRPKARRLNVRPRSEPPISLKPIGDEPIGRVDVDLFERAIA